MTFNKILEDKERFDLLVEYAKIHLADLIPYDDPNYNERLQDMAESYALSEINGDPEFEQMCKWHDEMLERGELPEVHGPYEDCNIDQNKLLKMD